MENTILQILMWVIPSGGIGAAIAWFANRKLRHVKNTKEMQDIYKEMYERLNKLLLETQERNENTQEKIEELTSENIRTRRALNRLSRAIEAIQLCPHRNSCPVRNELSLTEDDDKRTTGKHRGNRQHNNGNQDNGTCENSDVTS